MPERPVGRVILGFTLKIVHIYTIYKFCGLFICRFKVVTKRDTPLEYIVKLKEEMNRLKRSQRL